MTKIEYRVRPVTRYIVTRWEGHEDGRCSSPSSAVSGEYDNADMAYAVGYALCKAEHDRLGYPPGDERVTYPSHPGIEAVADIPFPPKRPTNVLADEAAAFGRVDWPSVS